MFQVGAKLLLLILNLSFSICVCECLLVTKKVFKTVKLFKILVSDKENKFKIGNFPKSFVRIYNPKQILSSKFDTYVTFDVKKGRFSDLFKVETFDSSLLSFEHLRTKSINIKKSFFIIDFLLSNKF